MSSTNVLAALPIPRSLVLAAGLFVAVLAPACANSDKPAAPQPDKPTAVTVEAKPVEVAKPTEDAPTAAKVAEEKAAAEKAAAEKAAAEKASSKESASKAVASAKAKGSEQAAKKDDAPKSVPLSKVAAAKSTKISAPTGILAEGAADELVKVGDRSVVRLLDAGAAPRAVASYALVKGTAKPLRMAMDVEMTLDAGEMKVPTTRMPRMVLLFDFSAGKRADVDWPIDAKLRTVTVEPNGLAQEPIAAALRPELDQLSGLGMNYFLDVKGRVRDVKVTLPPALPPMAGQMMSGMNQSIESMSAPLPDEPIGVGAQWESISRISANGADLLQIATFTLEKRKGNLLSVDAVIRQYAAKDAVNPPGMPASAKARLTSYKCQGAGKTVFDVADVAPRSGTTSVNSSMTIELKMNIGKQETSVETRTTASFSRPAS